MAIPTVAENTEFLIAVAKRLFPDADFSRGTPQHGVVAIIAIALTDGKIHADRSVRALSRRYADGDEQDAIGFVDGIPRKAATVARKDAALRVYGTAAATVAADLALTHSSGLRFVTVGATVVGALGFVDVGIASVDTGSAARLGAGETLEFDATPIGLADTAELQIAIDEGGDDKEKNSDYGVRLLAHTQDPPSGGADADYREWITSIAGIASAYVFNGRAGLGTVDIAGLHGGRGASRPLLAGENTALLTAINTLKPITAIVRVLTVTPEPTGCELLITDDGAAEHGSDWDDTSPGTVATWTFATRTLVFVLRPASLKAGDRIIFSTTAGTGAVYRVEALSGLNGIIVETAPSVAPIGGDTVYAGGSLASSVRDAVLAHYDTLGPSNSAAANYGSWSGTLRPAALARVALGIDGCRDVAVAGPLANVDALDPAWPLDGSIGLLTPGRVIVRWLR